ncbi:hypothetical protein [Lonsdalea britannica]|uniref:hypothetical protein n=1 Tax=Lonsdalea britannica TaxID=1082704 RepID=UPI0026F23F4F|nr:hypothetical protein [Lonsdalea britannica]
MKKDKLEDVKKEPVNTDKHIDTLKFISTDEDEQEGNFEFLCCRGGTHSPGMGGPSTRW